MTRRKNPFPGVRKNMAKGRLYWRFQLGDFCTNLPGPYGSPAFVAAYEAALSGAKAPRTTAPPGTLAWLIEQYLGSLRFQKLSQSRKRSIRGELDWLRERAGAGIFASMKVRHVELLMAKKPGPVAANTVKKNLSMLFNFALQKLDYTGPNPAKFAERMKANPDGYHTWTEAEIDRFLERHGPGTKARLVALLALNTGMARADLCGAGWQLVSQKAGKARIAYRRAKTGIEADMPILPDLAQEIERLPKDRLLFITQEGRQVGYKPETLGNWFRDRCKEAGVPGSLHGLRKAGATRLANAAASPDEIKAFLAHATNAQGSTYTRKADRARQADSGLGKLVTMSNPLPELDKREK